jgi:metal-sulfur cluster biosynthetic enzyme
MNLLTYINIKLGLVRVVVVAKKVIVVREVVVVGLVITSAYCPLTVVVRRSNDQYLEDPFNYTAISS